MSRDWRHSAACLGEDSELFFPIGTNTAAQHQAANAKAVCNGGDGADPCPVRAECLAWALETRQPHGVWGGLSEDERRTIARRAERDATKARKAASVAALERSQMRQHSQERRGDVATLTTRGLSAAEIGLRLNVTPRQVRRDRDQIRGAR